MKVRKKELINFITCVGFSQAKANIGLNDHSQWLKACSFRLCPHLKM